MGKKSSSRHRQAQAVAQPREAQSREAPSGCPQGGTKSGESALLLMDQLFRSHAELFSTLRFAGRELLQFEKQGSESLERIRHVLRRADHVRQMIQSREENPEMLDAAAPVPPAAEQSASAPLNADTTRKKSVSRPRSTGSGALRVIRFPNR
jgi:hypothetical protein